MRSEGNAIYEKPLVRTISAAELIEMIGPVQGYALGGGSTGGLVTTPLDGLDGGLGPDTPSLTR
jgi:hypothetical protein